MINLVRGRISLNELHQILKDTHKYFSEEGGFKNKEENVEKSMLSIASNVFSLANVSHSVVS